MKAIMEVYISEEDMIDCYAINSPYISKKHFISNYILKCIQDRGQLIPDTYKKAAKILSHMEGTVV